MIIIKDPAEIKKWRSGFNREYPNKTIGFVPTMGYLHEGHLSLIKKVKEETDFVVVSIFVNPIQFNDKKDFQNYPMDIEKDRLLLEKEEIDLLFLPGQTDMFSRDEPEIVIDYPQYTKLLCGKNRPGHFQGVLYIVHNLFQFIRPHKAVFGLKDYQQYLLIKKMTQELAFDIEILSGSLIRDENRLALSSRNARLSEEGYKKALVIPEALFFTRSVWENNKNTTAEELSEILYEKLKNLEIDYAGIYDISTLKNMGREETIHEGLVAAAVYIENVRLIDNLILR